MSFTVDNPPNLDIVTPKSDEIVQGLIALQIRAADDIELSTVEFALDRSAFEPLSRDHGMDTYDVPIDTTVLDGGAHSIVVRATDTAGNTSRAIIRIVVDNPPTIAIVRPMEDECSMSSVDSSASAASPLVPT